MEAASTSAQAKPATPEHEQLTISFEHPGLVDFELLTYKGELITKKAGISSKKTARNTGSYQSSEFLPEGGSKCRMLNEYRRELTNKLDNTRLVYERSKLFTPRDEIQKYQAVGRGDNVFEKKKAEEAFKNSGIWETNFAAQKMLPSTWNGYQVIRTSLFQIL